jgi:CHASE2 domain-containing sensor protein
LKKSFAIALLFLAPLVGSASPAEARGGFSSDFTVVMIDDATVAKLGPPPYDRSRMAAAVDACARLHAKAVVFKFFFDRPRTFMGDTSLAAAMRKLPVSLEARLDKAEGTQLTLPIRFAFTGRNLEASVVGDRGWIPMPLLSDAAVSVGFVDFIEPSIPLIERYQGESYPSLVLCCLELVAGSQATFDIDGEIRIGAGFLKVDERNVYTADLNRLEDDPFVSFSDLLEGNVAEGLFAGHVVVIGLDSVGTPTLSTAQGPMRIHRFFIKCLESAYRDQKRSERLH